MESHTTEQPTFYAIYDNNYGATMGAGASIEEAIIDTMGYTNYTHDEVVELPHLELRLVSGEFAGFETADHIDKLPYVRCYWNGNVANK